MNDDEILRAVAKGSDGALRSLYDRYSAKVFNTAISYLRNTEDAEEILQDVFISIHGTATKFQFNSSVSTWIYKICVNKSLDFIRKKNANKRKGIFTSLYKKDSGEIKYDTSDFEHPGVKLENKESAKFLFRVIDKLPNSQKTAFILTNIEDLSHQEAGDIMNSSRKAVESLVQRAKVNLRKGLEEYFPERGNHKKNASI